MRSSRSSKGMADILKTCAAAASGSHWRDAGRKFRAGRRQIDASLKMPVRDFQPLDAGVAEMAWQRSFAATVSTRRSADADAVGFDTRQRDQDCQPVIGLKNVDRRLPMRARNGGKIGGAAVPPGPSRRRPRPTFSLRASGSAFHRSATTSRPVVSNMRTRHAERRRAATRAARVSPGGSAPPVPCRSASRRSCVRHIVSALAPARHRTPLLSVLSLNGSCEGRFRHCWFAIGDGVETGYQRGARNESERKRWV